jgi:hypothetical protein
VPDLVQVGAADSAVFSTVATGNGTGTSTGGPSTNLIQLLQFSLRCRPESNFNYMSHSSAVPGSSGHWQQSLKCNIPVASTLKSDGDGAAPNPKRTKLTDDSKQTNEEAQQRALATFSTFLDPALEKLCEIVWLIVLYQQM